MISSESEVPSIHGGERGKVAGGGSALPCQAFPPRLFAAGGSPPPVHGKDIRFEKPSAPPQGRGGHRRHAIRARSVLFRSARRSTPEIVALWGGSAVRRPGQGSRGGEGWYFFYPVRSKSSSELPQWIAIVRRGRCSPRRLFAGGQWWRCKRLSRDFASSISSINPEGRAGRKYRQKKTGGASHEAPPAEIQRYLFRNHSGGLRAFLAHALFKFDVLTLS